MKRRSVIGLIIVLVGLILISLFEWAFDYQISQGQQHGNSEQNESALFRGPVFLGFRDGMASFWDWIHDNDAPLLVIFTAVLAVVTTFLVKFTRGLMIYTRHLWGSTSELVKGAERTARIQLRAYVGVFKIDGAIEDNSMKPVIRIKNCGQTPAYMVDGWLGAVFVKKGFDFVSRGTHEDSAIQCGVMHPGGEDEGVVEGLSAADVAAIRDGRTQLYVEGKITYTDIFKEPHKTEFLVLYEPQGKGGWSYCKHGNEAT